MPVLDGDASGAGIIPADRLKDLMKEADELVAIFAASIKTARANVK